MSNSNSNEGNRDLTMHVATSMGVPPVIPLAPHRTGASSSSKGLVIAVICVTMFAALLLAGGLLAAGLFARSRAVAEREARIAAKHAAAAREIQGERIRAVVPRENGASSAKAAPVAMTSDGSSQVEPGITYTNVKVANVPWSIHVLKIDRTQKDLMIYSAHARDKVLGVSFIADQARAVPREVGRAIAGVNGDFYLRDNPTYAGDPRGLQIINGDLISGPDTVCVWFDPDGNPHLDEVKGDFHIAWPNGTRLPYRLNEMRSTATAVLYTPSYGPSTRVAGGMDLVLEKDGDSGWLPLAPGQTYRARVREIATNGNTRLASNTMVLSIGPRLLGNTPTLEPGAILQISTQTTPDLKGVKSAIAGGPAIIRNGQRFSQRSVPPEASRNYSERSKYERHPRSAVGWSATHIYLVTVDGRQPRLSVGMKLAELAEFMAGLGCTEAMNLDGGKSAQMWMKGQIMNSPAQGEDTVANSLLVVRRPAAR